MKTSVKIKYLLCVLGGGITFWSCSEENIQIKKIEIQAPFEMPPIHVPDFSNCKTFLITDFGAKQNDKENTTQAIEKAIRQAHISGGGKVIVPKGEWITGRIHLKSNVNLHVSKGARLIFSEDPNDYLPPVHTSWEGMECYNYSPLIYAYKCKNIAITGEGELKAKLDVWRKWYKRSVPHMNSLKHLYEMSSHGIPVKERQMVNDTAHLRPQFIQFNRCENVLLEGVSIRNSPFWTIHPYLSKNVVIRNVDVYAHGHNNDGVDPEMTQNILIEDCVFDQGDDAIAVKAGRNQDAWRINTPTKNVVIRNCLIKNGHQLLAIGSELSGGIENVFMDNCEVADGAKMYNLLFIKTNERRGGYVKNIIMNNIKADKMRNSILGIETDVLYQWRNLVPTYEKRLTPISDVILKDIQLKEIQHFSKIEGQDALPIRRVFLTNVKADTVMGEPNIHKNIIGFNFED